jgi:hypothetical protein
MKDNLEVIAPCWAPTNALSFTNRGISMGWTTVNEILGSPDLKVQPAHIARVNESMRLKRPAQSPADWL